MTKLNDKKHDSLEEAFFTVVNSEILVWEALETALRENGVPITAGRLIPLHYLVGGPLRLQELTERIHAKPSAASRLIERMVSDGLVEKRPDERDGRAVLLHATEEGRRVEEAGCKVFEQCAEELFADFDEDDLHDLLMLLGRIEPPCRKAKA